MKYYVNNGSLHSSEIPIVDENFVEISEEEYVERLSTAVDGREIGTTSKNPSGNFISDDFDVIGSGV